MAKNELKYAKYIISNTPKNPNHKDPATLAPSTLVWVTNKILKTIQGAFYLEADIVNKADDEESIKKQMKAHSHPFNEYLIFLGTDPKNPGDLGGEVELWLGDEEKYSLTESCAVFVPEGLYHTPLIFKRVDRPIVMVRTGDTNKYGHLGFSNDPKWAGFRDGMDDSYFDEIG
jgi:hypothetical protein